MADIINLRRARKARDRATAQADAAANRVRHGQTKAARDAIDGDAARAKRLLDGHKIED